MDKGRLTISWIRQLLMDWDIRFKKGLAYMVLKVTRLLVENVWPTDIMAETFRHLANRYLDKSHLVNRH
jgi:hypothetical protein